MSKKLELNREDLEIGSLYYLEEKIKGRFSDSLIVWQVKQFANPSINEKDTYVDTIYMNVHNPFVVLEIQKDEEQFAGYSTYWYKVLTKYGNIGWFILDDEDMKLLYINFKKAESPDQ